MASPQKENGYVAIANEIAEALMRSGLNGTEWEIIMAVLRKTYGFNKKEDWISYTQFEKLTGKTRKTVWRSIESLVAKRILRTKKKPGMTLYGFNKDYSSWMVYKRKLVTKMSQTSYLSVQKVVTNRKPTKDIITKDTIQKTSIVAKAPKKEFSEDVKDLAHLLFTLIRQNNPNFKGDPVKWYSDMDKMMRIDGRTYLEIQHIIRWTQDDNFWSSNILSGSKLRKQFDQLWMKAKRTHEELTSNVVNL